MNFFLSLFLFFSFSIATVTIEEQFDFVSDSALENNELDWESWVEVSFFPEKRHYREGESYVFRITIFNRSPDKVFHFRVYDEPFQQFSFSIKKGYQEVSIKNLNYYRFLYDKRGFSSKNKTIGLGYQESYSWIIAMEDFFQLDLPGFYEITGNFYPLGVDETDYGLSIQPFTLRIHSREPNLVSLSLNNKNGILLNQQQNRFDILKSNRSENRQDNVFFSQDETTSSLLSTSLFPNTLVEDHFNRIRQRDYVGYLNNLDLDKLLVNSYSSTEEYMRYINADAIQKKIIIEEFKNFLIENMDYFLVDSSILRTSIIGNSARVEAIMAVREPFENYRRRIDETTGEPQVLWVKESINHLRKYYHLNFDLEKIFNLENKVWKIIGYKVHHLSEDQYQNYKNQILEHSESLISSASSESEDESLNQLNPTEVGSDHIRRTIYFAYNRDEVEGEGFSQIKKIAQFLIAHPELQVTLYGHTDIRGREKYNYELSKRRVFSVMGLLDSAGVELDRIRFFYKGESEPITLGNSEDENQLNRRVEIIINEPQP